MLQEQIMFYIREYAVILSVSAGAAALFLLLFVLVQVTRTRREVHKICKKVQGYLDVVLSEEEPEGAPVEEPAAERAMETGIDDDWQARQERRQAEEDAQLLMDVLSEVF